MNVLDRLTEHSTDTNSLDQFLSNNTLAILDWFNKLPYSELLSLTKPLGAFVKMKIPVWRELPLTGYNEAFLTMLLEKMEQLGEVGSFGRIFRELSIKGATIGSRLKAAGLYLVDAPTDAPGLLSLFDAIHTLLEEAVRNEDDNADKALSTIIQYYLLTIESFGEFNAAVPASVHDQMAEIIKRDPASFLRCQLMYDVLSVALGAPTAAAARIRQLLDEYLKRAMPVLARETGILVESGTRYCDLLQPVAPEWDAIRQVSVRLHRHNPDREDVWSSLHRGVAILDKEEQLWGYMYSYANMHAAKLVSAFEHVPFDKIASPVTVVDWGCGQGTATMVLFDYLRKNKIDLTINSVILIEPSDLALRRGGLHSFKFDNSTELTTINKVLDDVTKEDLKTPGGTTIHLFSNILDVDAVSLVDLSNLVKSSFPGPNVFVCASPYIDGKRIRLDSFMNSFAELHFDKLWEANAKKFKWIGEWTRMIRVFTAEF